MAGNNGIALPLERDYMKENSINSIYLFFLLTFLIITFIIIIIIIIIIITTKPRHIISSVNKNQIYSTYPMFIYVELAFGGHCLHFQVYTINSVI